MNPLTPIEHLSELQQIFDNMDKSVLQDGIYLRACNHLKALYESYNSDFNNEDDSDFDHDDHDHDHGYYDDYENYYVDYDHDYDVNAEIPVWMFVNNNVLFDDWADDNELFDVPAWMFEDDNESFEVPEWMFEDDKVAIPVWLFDDDDDFEILEIWDRFPIIRGLNGDFEAHVLTTMNTVDMAHFDREVLCNLKALLALIHRACNREQKAIIFVCMTDYILRNAEFMENNQVFLNTVSGRVETFMLCPLAANAFMDVFEKFRVPRNTLNLWYTFLQASINQHALV